MEETYKYLVIGDEATVHARVIKIIIRHRVVIKPELFVNFKLVLLNNFLGSCLFTKGS